MRATVYRARRIRGADWVQDERDRPIGWDALLLDVDESTTPGLPVHTATLEVPEDAISSAPPSRPQTRRYQKASRANWLLRECGCWPAHRVTLEAGAPATGVRGVQNATGVTQPTGAQWHDLRWVPDLRDRSRGRQRGNLWTQCPAGRILVLAELALTSGSLEGRSPLIPGFADVQCAFIPSGRVGRFRIEHQQFLTDSSRVRHRSNSVTDDCPHAKGGWAAQAYHSEGDGCSDSDSKCAMKTPLVKSMRTIRRISQFSDDSSSIELFRQSRNSFRSPWASPSEHRRTPRVLSAGICLPTTIVGGSSPVAFACERWSIWMQRSRGRRLPAFLCWVRSACLRTHWHSGQVWC